MIISHLRKFIFLKTRKTAGTSLEIALSRHCGDRDILTPINFDEPMRFELAGRRPQNFSRPLTRYTAGQLYRYLRHGKQVEVFTEHMTAAEVRKQVGEAVWNGYFKFTIVRNPFDRMLSRFFWTMKVRPGNRDIWGIETLDQLLRYRPEFVNENWLIYTQGDRVLVDDVVRYEAFEADLARISARIGLAHNLHDEMKSIRAKGDFRPAAASGGDKAALLGRSEIEIIRLLCAREIETFGYRVPEPAEEVADSEVQSA